MRIELLEYTQLHDRQQLDAAQKLEIDQPLAQELADTRKKLVDLEILQQQQQQLLTNMEMQLEQQQQMAPEPKTANANKRKKPNEPNDSESKKSKKPKRKSEFGRVTTPKSRWAGSRCFREKAKKDPPLKQKDVDKAETFAAILRGFKNCAAGKLHLLKSEDIGKDLFRFILKWCDPSAHGKYVNVNGERHLRFPTVVFSSSWYESEMGKDKEGNDDRQEVLFTDDDDQLTADMLFNFNGLGGEPNDAGVHCGYTGAIKNAGVETTLLNEAGQISYAPTAEELILTVDYNPNYRRILAKREKAALEKAALKSPCLDLD
jgi:hypothetical protein